MTIETLSVSKFWSGTSALLSLCMHSLVGIGLRADVGPASSTLFICATLLGVGGIRPHLVMDALRLFLIVLREPYAVLGI